MGMMPIEIGDSMPGSGPVGQAIVKGENQGIFYKISGFDLPTQMGQDNANQPQTASQLSGPSRRRN